MVPCPDRGYHYTLLRRLERRSLYEHIRDRGVAPREAAQLLGVLDRRFERDEQNIVVDEVIDWALELDEKIGTEAVALLLHGLEAWDNVPWESKCEGLRGLGIPWPRSHNPWVVSPGDMPLFVAGARAILPWLWRGISYHERLMRKILKTT